MLSNAYFLANFRFDTAENEPAQNLQKNLKKPQGARARPDVAALLLRVLRPEQLAQHPRPDLPGPRRRAVACLDRFKIVEKMQNNN